MQAAGENFFPDSAFPEKEYCRRRIGGASNHVTNRVKSSRYTYYVNVV